METVQMLKEKEKLDHKEAFSRSAELWKALDDAKKAPYEKKAKEDEERYQKQMKELETKGFFTNTDGVKSSEMECDAKKKYGKDIVMPKKVMSAYLYFTTDQMNKIKEKEGCTHPEAMKKAGEIWSKMSDKDKKKYNDMHEKD